MCAEEREQAEEIEQKEVEGGGAEEEGRRV